jgi:hypothetical protein
MNSELQRIRVEIAMLQVKSGVWGLVGGCIPVLITAMIYIMAKH